VGSVSIGIFTVSRHSQPLMHSGIPD
jgi:hypothetical protein